MFGIVEPILTERFVHTARMTGRRFENYPSALYATDVKFQQANRPTGTFSDAKAYFSAKHGLYGFKFECSVSAAGRAVFITRHYPGSKADVSIFEDHAATHTSMLLKTEAEGQVQDHCEGAVRYPALWAVLVDKGYQGIQNSVRSIQPKKQPRNGSLSADDIERNHRVSSDRVIVENYFGRLCMLWKIMYKKFTLSEERYDQILRLCVALTNFHVSLNPLRAEDSDYYGRTLARYASQAQLDRERRRAHNQAAVLRRRDRLNGSTSTSGQRHTPESFNTPSSGSTSPLTSAYNSRQPVSPRALQYEDESQDF